MTEELLRESIIARLVGHLFNKRITKTLNLLSKESPALQKANKRYKKASEELGDALSDAAKHRLKRKDREMY